MEHLWQVLRGNTTVVMHNASFDLQFLWSLGFEGYPTSLWDTMVVEQVLTAGLTELDGLESVAWRRLNQVLDKSIRRSFIGHRGALGSKQIQYAHDDADVLLPIMETQRPQVVSCGLDHIIDIENQLVPIVANMEYQGIGFDVEAWDQLVVKEQQRAKEAEQRVLIGLELPMYSCDLFSGTVRGINLNSWQQVLKAFKRCGIRVDSTSAPALKRYLRRVPNHPKRQIIEAYWVYKMHTKRAGFAYDTHVNPVTGRIHTNYRQAGTVTGRFGSSNPNLQNVPRPEEFRSLFVARPGWFIITLDYGQQEMRIMAEMSGDENLREVCRTKDPHLENTRRMCGDPSISSDDPRRYIGKNVNFAMGYGATAQKVAEMADISLQDAEALVQYTKQHFPQLMALAFGLGEESCGFDLHHVDPKPLLRQKDLL